MDNTLDKVQIQLEYTVIILSFMDISLLSADLYLFYTQLFRWKFTISVDNLGKAI